MFGVRRIWVFYSNKFNIITSGSDKLLNLDKVAGPKVISTKGTMFM